MNKIKQKYKDIKCTIQSRLEELEKVEHLAVKVAQKMALSEDQQDNLAISVTEAVGNAIVHGNKKDPSKKVYILFKFGKNNINVSVRDEGNGFNPDQLINPTDPENIMKESGRGIFILKTLMDNVKFSFSTEGTTVHLSMKKRE